MRGTPPRTYEEVFGEERAPVNTNGLSLSQKLAEVRAIARATKRIARERAALAKDGWTESEIEDLFADYQLSWATAYTGRAKRGASKFCDGRGLPPKAYRNPAHVFPQMQCTDCEQWVITTQPMPELMPNHLKRLPALPARKVAA